MRADARANQMAVLVVGAGVQPSEVQDLTPMEVEAIFRQARRAGLIK